MRPPRRLEGHPLTRIDRGRAFTFRHEGRRVRAHEGETVAAALYAEGHRVLSRSMRYHRARGLYCATGGCTHCFLRIDGVPNQRACLARCEPTTWSEGQNAFPSVEYDALAAADLAYPRYLDAHRAFLRPRLVTPLALGLIRRMAGFGRVPRQPVAQSYRHERLEPEVLVVGGGPAGLAAASTAAQGGARVTILESESRLGGRLRALPTPFLAARHEHAPEAEGKAWAETTAAELREHRVDVRTRTRLFARYEGRWNAASETTLYEMFPKRVVVATGALSEYPLVPGGDRAGVLLASAALRLLNVHGIAPADPVLILGATREGLLLARDLAACGVRVRGVYDAGDTPSAPRRLLEEARRLGIPVQVRHRAAYIAGRKRPRAVVFEGPRGRVRAGCATVVAATGRVVLGELFQQAGCRLHLDAARGGWIPVLGPTHETTVRGVYAAGSAAGVEDEWSSVLRGRIAGAAASLSLQPEDAARRRLLDAALDAFAHPPEGVAGPREVLAP